VFLTHARRILSTVHEAVTALKPSSER